MAEFPALTLWTDAYLADTMHLSAAEHGAYLLLLMAAWRRPHCDVPDDDRTLARLAAMTEEEWANCKATVMAFWTLDGRCKTWVQKRLLEERKAARARSKSARGNAKKRWSKNAQTAHKNSTAGDDISDNVSSMYSGGISVTDYETTENTYAPASNPHAIRICQIDATTATATATATEEEKEPPSPLKPSLDAREKKRGGHYAFEGVTVRLNQADFDRWRKIYHAIPDLAAELAGLDHWFSEHPEVRKRWFHVASSALNRKHQDRLADAQREERAQFEFTSPA